jgi:hypothetical protein
MVKTAFLLTLVVTAVASMPAHGQVVRAFVSAHGVDTNPCTVIQPCRTFQQAFNTVPPNSVIFVLDPAGYQPLTITHGITIQANGFGGITQVNGCGTCAAINVSATTSDQVTLDGLLLDGEGTGYSAIRITSGKAVQILNSVVRNFVNGIVQTTTPVDLFVSNTRILNTGLGIYASPGGNGVSRVVMSQIDVDHNFSGIAIDASSLGGGYVDAVLADSVVSSSGQTGVTVNNNGGSLARLTIVSSKLMFNQAFGLLTGGLGGTVVYLTRSTIFANGVPDIKIQTGNVYSAGDNMIGTNDPLTTFSYR